MEAIELPKEFVARNWPLTDVRIGALLRKSGNSQVGVIDANEGKYIYKIAHAWKTSETVERDLAAFEFLNGVGFRHVSKLLKSRDGKNHVALREDKLVYIIEYVVGEHPTPSAQTYGELGRIMGVMHNIQGFPFETDFDADIVVGDLKKNAPNYAFGDGYLEVLSDLPSFHGLPKTLVHTDISPTNTIRNEAGEFIVIDWDDVGIGTTVLDVGQPLINQFVSEDLEFHDEWLTAFYRAYFKEHRLTEAEMERIFDAGMFWACMYIIYGDTPKRWKRIQWALDNRHKLEALVRSCA